jgi:hypothetical protein
MPIEHEHGTTIITGNAIGGLRAFYCLQGLEMYLSSNGKRQLTRIATPGLLSKTATEYTGKKYARSRKGLQQAHDDLKALMAAQTLDQTGETAVVNKLVGGVASDLSTPTED